MEKGRDKKRKREKDKKFGRSKESEIDIMSCFSKIINEIDKKDRNGFANE
jgi:hypothetical protein